MTKPDGSSFEGVFSLLLTPFTDDLSVDWVTYERYVAWQIEQGPNGLFAVCGSSEMKWLTLDERLQLARMAVRLAGKMPVIATANPSADITTHEEELDRLIGTGVAGIVLVPPSGMGKDPRRLEDYFRRMAGRAACPVFYYEWPQVENYPIDPALYGRLCRDGLAAGIKDTTCTLEGIAAKIDASSNGAVVYQANTPFLLESFRRGARGSLGIVTTVYADRTLDLWHAFLANDPKAEAIQQDLLYLDAILRFSWPRMAKCLTELRGLPFTTRCRWPGEISAEAVQAARVLHGYLDSTR